MKLLTDTYTTPLGEFSVAVDEQGAVVATAFGNAAALPSRLPRFHVIRENARSLASENRPDQFHVIREIGCAQAVREQVLDYFAGKRTTFDLPLALRGTAFQQRVWAALQEIPCGETRSYGQLATQLGRPYGARAVGRANATNPICLIVPCHRVIGRDGTLTGFAFGEKIKGQLLAHERSLHATSRAA